MKGPGVTSGYYKKPEATAAAFDAQGWLCSGDLGRLDADGYITLLGRTKESYRCGGEQVLPSEIEDVLAHHPAVDQAHVVPVPDERMGEAGAAFIIARPGIPVTEQALVEFCGQRLARFKIPKYILFIQRDDVPVTATGRPRKFLLVERAKQQLGIG